jgi:predicted phosphodiesterase
MRKITYLPIFPLLLLVSCANYQLNYTGELADWQETSAPEVAISHQVFLIGDAGGATAEWTPPILAPLQRALAEAAPASTLVLLGDNIYPNGLAPKSQTAERTRDELALDAQLALLEDFAGQAFFVAGNHDWYGYGIDGLQRQARYLNKQTDGQAKLLPRPGCGDPVEIELTDDLTLLLLDSQWWLANWDGESEINDGCEAKSRADFSFLLQEAFKGNRRKELLVAMHHPLYSKGQHGGNFSFAQHIFPLRDINSKLYLPLPVVGTALRVLQSSIGTRQDLTSTSYRDWRRLLLQHAQLVDRVIFAAGHEHNLQFWERDGHHFVVSGSGSRREPSKTGNGALFAYGEYGFSRIDYHTDGQVWVNYFAWDEQAQESALVLRRQIRKASEGAVEAVPTDIAATFSAERERRIPVSEVDFSRTPTGEKIWGEHYRAAYRSEITVSELDLAAEGLAPVKRGGGFQTNSLRLESPETGRQYTLRSIDKDASRTVPYPLNTDLILDIVGDNFSASHPLAALAVVPLAKEAGVYHANPQLVYLPSQPALGPFNADYAEALYLFEERPDDDHWQDAAHFGQAEEVISTFDVLEETREEHDKRVDQPWVVRSRLFDLVIGDWDRHDDQWRWAKIDRGENEYFRPIPRDRDQAFANYDGLIFSVARQLTPKSKQWRPYSARLGRTHWATYNAYLFDQTFLTELEWSDWQEAIQHLQRTLTDDVIDTAFVQTWPEPFLSREGTAIKATLRDRRDQLEAIARDYYEYLAREVTVLGTDKKDLFLIERDQEGLTRVRVFNTNKKGEREGLLYERYFSNDETQVIHCYGLADDDIFEVRGEVKSGPKVDLIGGEGEDTFDDQSGTSTRGPLVDFYDFKAEDSRILADQDSRDKRSKRAQLNLYDRRGPSHLYNFNSILPGLAFNPDDLLLLGFNGTYTRYGFQKKPFASRHQYGAHFSPATKGVRGHYRGLFIDILGSLDFQFDFDFQTPLYASNFYGLGNETITFEESRGVDYHRVRQQYLSLAPQLAWRPNEHFQVALGPRLYVVEIEATQGRFLETQLEVIPEEVFEDIGILSWELALQYQNLDQLSFPTRGLQFDLQVARNRQVDGDRYNYTALDTELSLYRQLDAQGKLVFATRLGLQHRFGENEDFPFYLGAKLGGLGPQGNLRGFRRDRFTGRTAFYHNTDLRWKVAFWANKLLPMSVGLTASFDYGKVSLKDIESEVIHYSYGPGLFLSPFDLFTLHVGSYRGSEDDWRWLVGGAFFF